MSVREVRLELLLGRAVLAQNGRRVGRIEEVRAERSGAGYFVTEYHVGPTALLERLALGFGSFFGRRRCKGYAIAWDQIDLSDLDRPLLTCAAEELRELGPEDEHEEPEARRPRRRSPKG